MSAGDFPYNAPVRESVWSRLRVLEGRGLVHGLALEVYDAGALDVLAHLERTEDAGKIHCCAGVTVTTVCSCGQRLYPLVWTAGR